MENCDDINTSDTEFENDRWPDLLSVSSASNGVPELFADDYGAEAVYIYVQE